MNLPHVSGKSVLIRSRTFDFVRILGGGFWFLG